MSVVEAIIIVIATTASASPSSPFIAVIIIVNVVASSTPTVETGGGLAALLAGEIGVSTTPPFNALASALALAAQLFTPLTLAALAFLDFLEA